MNGLKVLQKMGVHPRRRNLVPADHADTLQEIAETGGRVFLPRPVSGPNGLFHERDGGDGLERRFGPV